MISMMVVHLLSKIMVVLPRNCHDLGLHGETSWQFGAVSCTKAIDEAIRSCMLHTWLRIQKSKHGVKHLSVQCAAAACDGEFGQKL